MHVIRLRKRPALMPTWLAPVLPPLCVNISSLLSLRFLCLFAVLLPALPTHVLFGAAPLVILGSPSVYEVPSLPLNSYFPDGHTAMVPDGSGALVFAAGDNSYRIELDSTGSIKSNPSWPLTTPVLAKGTVGEASYSYDNGGAWLYSVHRVGNTNRLLGFYHAEDHWPGIQTSIADYTWIAWKSVALAISEDDGKTWQKRGQIITSSRPRPSHPEWGGVGDQCVVWDAAHQRWLCFYGSEATNGLCMAQSIDPEGAPGSWFKFFNGSFNEPGIGGRESPVPGLGSILGANPSVHFNSKLNRWIMVFHSHDDSELENPNSLFIASSLNLVQWDTPALFLAPSSPYQRFWNPTILGSSDVSSGESATLYYGAWPDKKNPRRQMLVRDIVFDSISAKVEPTLDASSFIISGSVGSLTSFLVTGSESPTSFRATNLPSGITMSSLGRITGVPTIAGLSLGSVVALNEVGESKPAALVFVTDADVFATSSQGAVVTYWTPTAASLGLKSISGSPESGSVFPIGTSSVTVTAVYESGRTESLSFKVTVRQRESGGVVAAPKIVTAPLSASVNAGAFFTLKVTAKGNGHLSYQWRKDGVEIPGATFSNLVFNSVSSGDAGSYDVVVRAADGASVQSASAVLSLNVPATIRAQPSGLVLVSGQSGTLTLTASGEAPLLYQWRKDGKILPGATASSYAISHASELDEGSYDVIVFNVAGFAVSDPALVTVGVPTEIVRPPADVSLAAGSVVTLSVLARGSGNLAYQWFRNGELLPAANSAQFSLGALNDAKNGIYRVEVAGNYGRSVSASAEVNVLASNPNGALAILRQPKDSVILQGSAVSLPVAVEPATMDTLRTRYQLHLLVAGALTPLALAGNIGADGQLNLPLGSLLATSRDYVLLFSREFRNGTVIEAHSQPFRVETRSWDDAAGTYEALLVDQNVKLFDGAHYRGLLSMSVSRNGSVSGRILYDQVSPVSGGSTDMARIYLPVTRVFSGAFVPDPAAPLQFSLIPKLHGGAQAVLQEMSLNLDFGSSPVALSVTVRDHAFTQEETDCVSGVECVTRLPAGLPAIFGSLPGHYTVVANGLTSTLEDSGHLLLQVLPSGRVVWTSRFPGYVGCGSATLNTNDPANPSFDLYEARAQSNASILKTNTWLAQIGFKTLADNTRQAQIGSGKLERHCCYVGKLPAVNGSSVRYMFNPQTHWGGVSLVDFSRGDGVRWAKGVVSGLPAFLMTNTPMRLTVSDSQMDGNLGTYAWDLNVSPAGLVKATGIASDQSAPPFLKFHLDKTSGELLGSYAVNGVRRSVFGVALRADESARTMGRGWIEMHGVTRVAPMKWRLELTP